MTSLNQKIALVTGGSRDIGEEVAVQLAQAGARVCINYLHEEEKAHKVLERIQSFGGQAILVKGDMTNAVEVQQVVKACTEAYGPVIDILVNVAGGLMGRKLLADLDLTFWNNVFAVNATTVFLLTQAVVPHMSNGGSIINFSSQAARDGGGFGAVAYAAAKGAVLTMTKGWAKELGPKGIRVNCISPGMINTTFHDTFTKDEVRKTVAAATPLRREGQAAEVGALALYLAGEGSSFITGASIEINGGTYFV